MSRKLDVGTPAAAKRQTKPRKVRYSVVKDETSTSDAEFAAAPKKSLETFRKERRRRNQEKPVASRGGQQGTSSGETSQPSLKSCLKSSSDEPGNTQSKSKKKNCTVSEDVQIIKDSEESAHSVRRSRSRLSVYREVQPTNNSDDPISPSREEEREFIVRQDARRRQLIGSDEARGNLRSKSKSESKAHVRNDTKLEASYEKSVAKCKAKCQAKDIKQTLPMGTRGQSQVVENPISRSEEPEAEVKLA